MNDDANLYVNFALLAILGRLSEADALMRTARPSIQRVADTLRMRMPIAPRPLYRGVLLDGPLRPEPHITFVSWSEDRDVACWFASRDAIVSQPLIENNPRLSGHVIAIEAPQSRVLIHHAWLRAFGDFAALALLHPLMGRAGQQQIAWALHTQHEVITEPVAGLVARPITELDHPPVSVLDRKLAPPWLIGGAS